jgi:hypothetical protein
MYLTAREVGISSSLLSHDLFFAECIGSFLLMNLRRTKLPCHVWDRTEYLQERTFPLLFHIEIVQWRRQITPKAF